MDWYDLLIVVAFMSFPLVGVLIDKTLGKSVRKGQAPVTAPPPVVEKPKEEAGLKGRFSGHTLASDQEGQKALASGKPGVQDTLASGKAFAQHSEKKKAEPIDKKKLIVYSEIMKPKFDE